MRKIVVMLRPTWLVLKNMQPTLQSTATPARARRDPTGRRRGGVLWLALLALACLPTTASASFLQGEALDNFATYMAWFVITVMPIGLIVGFWKLHVLPEKIAAERHHPQKDAIHVLCLLSLFVGGLLWPLAWLWAYTRPTGYYAAYGTNKHEDYFHEMAEKWEAGNLSGDEIHELREELEAMAAKSPLPVKLKTLRQNLVDAAAPPLVATAADGGA